MIFINSSNLNLYNKISGIYCIIDTRTRKTYVGRSINLSRRFKTHKTQLKNNNHYNKYLQYNYNSNKFIGYEYYIVEFSKNNLEKLEDKWMSKFNSKNLEFGYNFYDAYTGGRLGLRHTEESKQKMSKSRGKPFKLVDPQGKIVEGVNFTQYCKDNNLDRHKLSKICTNHLCTFQGWTKSLEDYNILQKWTSFEAYKKNQGKSVKIKNTKTGEVKEIFNRSEFAKTQNSTCSEFSRMVTGRRASWRGWALYNEI